MQIRTKVKAGMTKAELIDWIYAQQGVPNK